MDSRRAIACLAGLTAALSTTTVFAGTIFRAERIDYADNKHQADVRVIVSDQATRIDISEQGRDQISFIETRDRLLLVDFVAGVFTVRDTHRPDTVAVRSAPMRATSRKQFALGGYCHVFEVHWSDAVYQERCAAPPTVATHFGARSNEFLALAVATGDPRKLFATASRSIFQGEGDYFFPYVIRHFESGKIIAELRMVSAIDDELPRSAFDVPRGLRRIAIDDHPPTEAAR